MTPRNSARSNTPKLPGIAVRRRPVARTAAGRNPRRNFPIIVASIRAIRGPRRWRARSSSPPPPQPRPPPLTDIRIQLSSFRNNCCRFPDRHAAFPGFYLLGAPLSPSAARHPSPLPPRSPPSFSDPSILHSRALLAPYPPLAPSLFSLSPFLSSSLSLRFPAQPTLSAYPSTRGLYLSLPFFRSELRSRSPVPA